MDLSLAPKGIKIQLKLKYIATTDTTRSHHHCEDKKQIMKINKDSGAHEVCNVLHEVIITVLFNDRLR